MKNKDVFIKELLKYDEDSSRTFILNILNARYGGTKSLLLLNEIFNGNIDSLSDDVLFEIAKTLDIDSEKYFENITKNITREKLQVAIENLNLKYGRSERV